MIANNQIAAAGQTKLKRILSYPWSPKNPHQQMTALLSLRSRAPECPSSPCRSGLTQTIAPGPGWQTGVRPGSPGCLWTGHFLEIMGTLVKPQITCHSSFGHTHRENIGSTRTRVLRERAQQSCQLHQCLVSHRETSNQPVAS